MILDSNRRQSPTGKAGVIEEDSNMVDTAFLWSECHIVHASNRR